MTIKSSPKAHYFVWLAMLTAFFIFDSAQSYLYGEHQFIGSWSIRFLFEFTVILGIYGWFYRKLTAWHLFPLTALVYFLIWQEWIDTGFKSLVGWLNDGFDIVLPVYPQMGLMILASISMTGLLFIAFTKWRTTFRFFALGILFLFSSFFILAHWQTLTNLSERTELILDGYKKLTIKDVEQFRTLCEGSKFVCFYGPYTSNPKEYSLIFRSSSEKDVPEHSYFVPSDFDGFEGINDHSRNSKFVSFTWSTNYLEYPTIDSPLKFVSYNKFNNDVFILIDDYSYLKTKQGVINLLKPFLFIFGCVWVLGGVGIFLMHSERRR